MASFRDQAKDATNARIETTASGIAKPTKDVFDAWNSASTGHQRGENRLSGSGSWRDSRNRKLAAQYDGGFTGGKRIADSIGAGSEGFGKEGRTASRGWVKGASGLREKSQKSILESFGGTVKQFQIPAEAEETTSNVNPQSLLPHSTEDHQVDDNDGPDAIPPSFQSPSLNAHQPSPQEAPKKQIFRNLCIYINGSTAPLISDHKLKYLLTQHGARMSIALGRRSVTHVILGNTHGKGGAGGGLAGTKIQKEISRIGGKSIKFVSVEWVLESLKAGKRQPETRFETLQLGGYGQGSVYSAFKTSKPTSSLSTGNKG